MSKKFCLLLISLIYIFLPQNSYADNSVPVSDGFDFPLGKPDGAGYGVECCGGLPWLGRYDYETDGVKEYHPGEDWNGVVQDAGDPVYAISDGTIIYAQYAYEDWGFLVLIEHRLRSGDKYWSQYAHLSSIPSIFLNKRGAVVRRGDVIGSIGDFRNGSGRNYHLHFEIRKKYRKANEFVYDWPREKVEGYYVNPSEFIRANRPLPPPTPQKLALVSASQGAAELSWDECTDPAFANYELYRSEKDGDNGDLVSTFTTSKTLSHKDAGLYSGQDYYYILITHYSDGRAAISNEIKVNIPRESVNISSKSGVQEYIGAGSGKIYWQDNVRESDNFPERKTFYYYDLTDKSVKTVIIGDPYDNRLQGPDRPQVAGDWLCYNAKSKRTGGYGVFCRNLAAGNMSADIRISPDDGLDHRNPSISEEGIVVWKGGQSGRLWWADLRGSTEVHQLTETTVHEPKIWGRNIIYQEPATTKNYNLWITNLDSGAKTLIKKDIDISFSDIWENYVVFRRGGNTYMVDISNPTTEILLAEKAYSARIRDGKVVYTKPAADGMYHVYVYIIGSGKTFNVAGPLKYAPEPVIYENYVAYNDVISESPIDTEVFLTSL